RDLTLDQRAGLDALLGCAPDDLVLDVGDVADERYVDAAAAQVAVQHVGGDHGAGVPDVGARVGRHAAPVDADATGDAGGEPLLALVRTRPKRPYSSSSRRRANTE